MTSSPRAQWVRTAARFPIVPDGTNKAASLPRRSAANAWSRLTVGSSPKTSSPTSARAIASLIAGVGWVTVSERRSTIRECVVVISTPKPSARAISCRVVRRDRPAGAGDGLNQIVGQRCFEGAFDRGLAWQAEPHPPGVQHLPPQAERGPAETIHAIAGDRASEECQVDADLVRPAGAWHHLEQRVLRERLPQMIVGRGRPTLGRRDDPHPLAMTRVAPNRRLDATTSVGRPSVDQGQIDLL